MESAAEISFTQRRKGSGGGAKKNLHEICLGGFASRLVREIFFPFAIPAQGDYSFPQLDGW
jgi:hypothetical protein